MKFLHLISSLDPKDGGPPEVVLRLAMEQRRAGHHVVVRYMGLNNEDTHPLFDRAGRSGVHLIRTPVEKRTRLRLSLRYVWAALRVARAFDVVVVHGFYQGPAIIGGMLGLMSPARRPLIVFAPHGVLEPYQQQLGSRWKPIFARLVGLGLFRPSTLAIAASEQERESLATTRGFRAGIEVVGFGQDPRPATASQTKRTEMGILFLSRVAAKKRLDLLIDALGSPSLRECRFSLHVCGEGDEQYIEDLKSRCFDSLNIHWHGHVTGAVRARIEARCAVFCLPSDNENYAVAITEAMAAELACVVSSATGASSHVERAGAGLVLTSPTADTLGEALRWMHDHPSERAAMGVRGRMYVEEHLSWSAILRTWDHLLLDALGERQ